jgi:hypothetical protein
MKKRAAMLVLTVVLSVVTLASTAQAQQITTTGPAFNIFTGNPTTFAAGAPFHFLLGWEQLSTDAIGKFSWSLDVDGTPRAPDFHQFGPSPVDPNTQVRAWFWNFPDGMPAGTHTFTAHGFTPCYLAVASFGYTGTCSNPNEVVEATTLSMTVNFS